MYQRLRQVAVCLGILVACGYDEPLTSRLHETHPFQEKLICELAPGSYLKGWLFHVADGKKVKIGEYTTGHVGACEMALRASRNGRVCVNRSWQYEAIEVATQKTIKKFGSDFDSCTAFTKGGDSLEVRDGFVEFIDDTELADVLKNFPQVQDPLINQVLHDPETMWYDEASMVFTYQDSFGNPQGPEGLRANRVGYDVGIHASHPDIRLLTKYFKHGKFQFPFAIEAGANFQDNIYVMNFWAPPVKDGKRLPVAWWKNESHWHWVFPVGTVIGEVFFQHDPTDTSDKKDWFVFEIRSRVRQTDGWKTDVFRPFVNAAEMAAAIRQARPDWKSTDLAGLISHLEDTETLQPAVLETNSYEQIIKPLRGYKDYLPAVSDVELIKSFLTERTFKSAMNKRWKESGSKNTFAAATHADFHIVPKNYEGALFETTESACVSCHAHTGQPLGQLNYKVSAYGEIWGEDYVFTWHPFQIDFDSFTVSDGNRRANPRLVQAGLLVQKKPEKNDPDYTELPKPYNPDYRN